MLALPVLILGGGLLASGLPPLLPEGPPQVTDGLKVFLAADPVEGDLQKALLVCRVDIVGDRGWDTFGAVDLMLTFSAPRALPVDVWGPEDRSSAVVSVPAFTLAKGQKLKISVEDRDLTEREHIAAGTVSYTGVTPFRLDLADVQIECRALSRADADARAAPLLERASSSIAAVEAAVPDLTQPHFARPLGEWAEAEGAVRDAASWIGADDAVVRRADKRLDVAMAAFQTKTLAAIAHAKRTLPPVGTPFAISSLGLEARVVPGPAVSLELTAKGADAKFFERDIGALVTFLAEKGTYLERGAEHVRDPAKTENDGELTLAAGAVHKMRIRVAGGENVPEIMRIERALVRAR